MENVTVKSRDGKCSWVLKNARFAHNILGIDIYWTCDTDRAVNTYYAVKDGVYLIDKASQKSNPFTIGELEELAAL